MLYILSHRFLPSILFVVFVFTTPPWFRASSRFQRWSSFKIQNFFSLSSLLEFFTSEPGDPAFGRLFYSFLPESRPPAFFNPL